MGFSSGFDSGFACDETQPSVPVTMCTAIQIYTGQELTQLTLGKPIGSIGAAEIDMDISGLGANSQSGIAKMDFETWASECNISVCDLSPTKCNWLTLAVKWYAIWRYKRLDMNLKQASGDKCCKDDTTFLDYALNQVCEYLFKFSQCLKDKFLASVFHDCTNPIPSDLWGTTLINGCEC